MQVLSYTLSLSDSSCRVDVNRATSGSAGIGNVCVPPGIDEEMPLIMPVPHVPHRVTDQPTHLIAQVRAGDPHALGAIYDEFAPRMLRIAYQLLGSREDAEDAVHDMFLGLPEALRRYDERGALRGWLTTRMVRVALMRLRSVKRRREDALVDNGHTSRNEPGDRSDASEIERAITMLPDALRAVFVLRQIEGFTHPEIASLLGISEGNSRVRHTRALEQLRARITR